MPPVVRREQTGPSVAVMPPASAAAKPAQPEVKRIPEAPSVAVQAPVTAPVRKEIVLTGNETVGELAAKLDVSAVTLIKSLMSMKILLGITQRVPPEVARKLIVGMGHTLKMPEQAIAGQAAAPTAAVAREKPAGNLRARAPVVTVMGHVDHGKTTILDAIRKTRIAQKEYGQITQKIGAYRVLLPAGAIVFLDTPGHEAFTEMRARGARVTDIVVLVVAADEGFRPQTVEAVNHARSAGVPIIVAINKIDKPNANVEMVKKQLAEHGLLPEDWGGQTVCVPVSGLTGEGLEHLLEMILLVAELEELRADPDRPAEGAVIESHLHRARGPVLTVLVQNGTLRVGDPFIAGDTWGKVRALLDDSGERLAEAGPSTPVEVLGAAGVASAGASFRVVASEREARESAERAEKSQGESSVSRKVSLDRLRTDISQGTVRELRIILKADFSGSLEAIRNAIGKIPATEVVITFMHTGIGPVTESDVLLAAVSNAVVIGFNVTADAGVMELARREGVEVKTYHLIYDLVDEIRMAVEGLLEPVEKEVTLGQALVKKVFALSRGTVAGCLVVEGKMVRNARARVIREGKKIAEGVVSGLKRFKDSVREVAVNTECGVELSGFSDFREGDVIQAIEIVRTTRTLEKTPR